MSIFSETIDYSKKSSLHSAYRWIKLSPVGGTGSSFTPSLTSSNIVNFEIPNNVCNLSRAKLCFSAVIGAQGAGFVPVMNGLPLSHFERITLATRSGVILANVDSEGQFTDIITKLKTRISQLTDNPNGSTYTGRRVMLRWHIPLYTHTVIYKKIIV